MTNTNPQAPLSHQKTQPEEVHLRDYVNVILRRRKTFLLTLAVVFLLRCPENLHHEAGLRGDRHPARQG